MDDAAPSDLKDDTEYVTFDSDEYGEFSACDRLAMVREVLLDELMDPNAEIFEGTACIFKYEYERVENIMVGMVQKVFVDPETKKINLIQVLNCPPKGASMDNLYVHINAEQAFHLRYKVKVTDTIERSMLLAINLEINKSDGKFSKKRKSGTKYSSSSYATAKMLFSTTTNCEHQLPVKSLARAFGVRMF